jgi:NAD(P)-dependent dehydrogenase (short-subunit alcohol dehydrogenase family)
VEDLRDKVVLVTGGAGGLGSATCRTLAEAGAVVVVADLDEDRGSKLAGELGGHFVAVDVTDLDANRAMVKRARELAGGLDLAFLNAGVTTGCGIGDDFDLANYRRAMGVNLDGVVFGTHAVLDALREQGRGGAIVATASLAGLTGVPLGPGLAPDGIRVNAVCPGFAESAMVEPIRDELERAGFRIIPAQDVAAVVLGLFEGDMTGECWFVQPGRTGPFGFRNVPGPRLEPAA